MIRVKINRTYRGTPYAIELEASDKTDIIYLLNEDIGKIMEEIENIIDKEIDKSS